MKTIRLRGDITNDYFGFEYNRKSDTNINYYLDQFNIDDYYIYKRTAQQREITKKDFMDFKYAGYIFFIKSKYDKEYINMWLSYYYEYIDEIKFLDKPLPPYSPEKIKIKK